MAKKRKYWKGIKLVSHNPTVTVGMIKKGEERKYTRSVRKVGAISVELLKEFLKPRRNKDVIGVYVNKSGKLAPLHCKRRVIAPILCEDSHARKEQEMSEFD